MAIKIPVYLQNQTGPEWQRFVQQAQQAGLNAQKAAADVTKELSKRNTAEQAAGIKYLADSFDPFTRSLRAAKDEAQQFRATNKEIFSELTRSNVARPVGELAILRGALNQATRSGNSLSQAVWTLNAFNITPYGYERFAYRASLAFEALGKAALPIGAAIGVAATAYRAFNTTLEHGNEQAGRVVTAYHDIGFAFEAMSMRLGKTAAFQAAMRGMEDTLTKVSEIESELIPTIGGAGAMLLYDLGLVSKEFALGAGRAAMADIKKTRKEIEDLKAFARREDSRGFISGEGIKSGLSRHARSLEEISDESKLTDMIRKKNQELIDGAVRFDHSKRGEREYGEFEKKTKGEISNLEARRNKLLADQANLKKELNRIEKQGALGTGAADASDNSYIDISKTLTEKFKEIREASANGTLTQEKQVSLLRTINDLISKRKQFEGEVKQIDEDAARLKKRAAEGEIKDLQTVSSVVRRRLELEKQLKEESDSGKLSMKDELILRRQILQLKERELDVTRAISNEVDAARKNLLDTIKGRADIFGGKAHGPGQGLLGQIVPGGQGRGDRDEVTRELAQQRGTALAQQMGITDPGRIRQIIAGQMGGLRSGQIGIGSKDPKRRLSQTELIDAQLQVGRRRLANLAESGVDPVTIAALSKSLEDQAREAQERASQADAMRDVGRRNPKFQGRNALTKAQQDARRQGKAGAATRPQVNNVPALTDKLAGAVVDAARGREGLDSAQTKALETAVRVQVEEANNADATRRRVEAIERAMINEAARRRAGKSGLSN